MKTSEFQKYFGDTTVFMKRLYIATKVCGRLTSNETYFADSCFSSVKKSEEDMAARVYYYGPVKTIYKGFCLSTLEKFMKIWPGGSYLVMKITPRVPGGIPLLGTG